MSERNALCVGCGDQFTLGSQPRQVYCSNACKVRDHNAKACAKRRVRHQPRPCPTCGEDFIPSRSDSPACSPKCISRFTYLRKYPNRTRHDGRSKKPLHSVCRGCAAVMAPQTSTFCSRACIGRFGRKKQTAAEYERVCTACGEVFTTFDKRPRQCSKSCAQWARNFPGVPRIRVGTCAYCLQPFDAHQGNQRFCSRECIRSMGHHRRRAAKRGVLAEPVSRIAIAERDKWICQLCGKRVRKRLKYPDPMSQSLDHIVPITLGGEHTTANCQLTHLLCNVRKNNRITEPVQLALIG